MFQPCTWKFPWIYQWHTGTRRIQIVLVQLVHGIFHAFTSGMLKIEYYKEVCSSLVHGIFHGFTSDMVEKKDYE